MIGRQLMHWIRIDRYPEGGVDDPQTVHEPIDVHALRRCALRSRLPEVAATVHWRRKA